jgi:hypothetical protein
VTASLLLLGLLLSFEPSNTPGTHTECWAWQRGMEERWMPGDGVPAWSEAKSFPTQVFCDVLHDPEFGEGWAEVQCNAPLCAFCIYAVLPDDGPQDEWARSSCGEVTGYVEDIR